MGLSEVRGEFLWNNIIICTMNTSMGMLIMITRMTMHIMTKCMAGTGMGMGIVWGLLG
jgi:hypothetical protein